MRTLQAMEQTSEEADRWAAALAGSGEAFAWLFDLHRDRVYRHALRVLGNVHDAEDVTAGAFLELWRRREAVTLGGVGVALPPRDDVEPLTQRRPQPPPLPVAPQDPASLGTVERRR